MSVLSPNPESPRNSPLREKTEAHVQKIVKLINDTLPWLTPNHITMLGTAGIGVFSIYVAKLEKEGRIDFKTSVKLLLLFIFLSATDALDGGLARYKDIPPSNKGPLEDAPHDFNVGQLVDSLSDRVQEAFSSWLRMYLAASRGDKLWLASSTLTALTNPLSSLTRAWAESKGVFVKESGKNIFQLPGTRVGKVGASAISTLPHKQIGEIVNQEISAQAIVDLLVSLATVSVAVSRLKTVANKRSQEKVEQDNQGNAGIEENIDNAKVRLKWLAGLFVVTGAITVALLKNLSNKDIK